MKVNCPTCEKDVEWGEISPYRPFCSKKCQLIDLGEWANEERTIAVNSPDKDSMQEIDVEDIEAMLSQQDEDFFKPS